MSGRFVPDHGELARLVAEARAAGKRVVFTNGGFEVLHVGHVRSLRDARSRGDLLVVAVNSDASARELKGPDRPVVPATERAELVAGFECVDLVVVFPETDVARILRELRPDVHCKGTDYTADSVPEREVAAEIGARVAIVGDAKRHATRDLIGKIRRG